MALGSNYSNNSSNGNSQNFEPTYYSRLRIKNAEQNISLTFNFWKGTLKILLSESSSDMSTKPNDLAFIHLSPTKARIMEDAVNRILSSDADQMFGVDTGSGETRGFIAICRENGQPFLFIAKVNSSGGYETSQRFNFNMDTNYLLNVEDLNNLKVNKEYMNNVELMMFRDVLGDYARFASGAAGASFYDIGRYENGKVSNMIRKLAGVSYGNNKGNNTVFDSANTGSYSSNNQQNSRGYTSIDSLEDELG